MKAATALLALLPAALLAGSGTHFEIQATFVPPPSAKADGAVAVLFTAKDPDVKINEVPAPRLKLDPSQSVLVERPAAGKRAEAPETPDTTRSLDLGSPVRFPVTLGAAAVKGTHLVKGSLAYFYCSKREGWCRKGTSPVEIPVLIP